MKRIGRLAIFWQWGRKEVGLEGPTPFLPYDWRLFLGPVCLAMVTKNRPTKWTRQRKRAAVKDAGRLSKKARRRLAAARRGCTR